MVHCDADGGNGYENVVGASSGDKGSKKSSSIASEVAQTADAGQPTGKGLNSARCIKHLYSWKELALSSIAPSILRRAVCSLGHLSLIDLVFPRVPCNLAQPRTPWRFWLGNGSKDSDGVDSIIGSRV